MIPFVLLQIIPGILDFFALVLRWLRILKNRRDANQNFIDIAHLLANFLNMTMLWFNLIMSILRWMRIRRQKRYLLKPHLLIALLGGYRLFFVLNIVYNFVAINNC